MIHYAPYGKNAAGKFDCGASDGGYTDNPSCVTCIECKKRSPGLWPEFKQVIKCKNTRYDHECHPHYAKKYHGYCLDCVNAGIDEADERMNSLVEEIQRLKKENQDLRDLLSEHEFCNYRDNHGEPEFFCQYCGRICGDGNHFPSCEFAKALCLPTGEKK